MKALKKVLIATALTMLPAYQALSATEIQFVIKEMGIAANFFVEKMSNYGTTDTWRRLIFKIKSTSAVTCEGQQTDNILIYGTSHSSNSQPTADVAMMIASSDLSFAAREGKTVRGIIADIGSETQPNEGLFTVNNIKFCAFTNYKVIYR